MVLWKRLIAYFAYGLAGAVVTLLLMDNNVRTHAYVGNQSLSTLSAEQGQAAIRSNPGEVSFRSEFIVRGATVMSLPSVVALVAYLLPLPLLALWAAHTLLHSGVSLPRILLFGAGGLFCSWILVLLLPRA